MDFKHIPHPAPVPGETRAEAIADPGFGKIFTDHMVVIDYDADKGGWHSAKLCAREPIALDPAAAAAARRGAGSTFAAGRGCGAAARE